MQAVREEFNKLEEQRSEMWKDGSDSEGGGEDIWKDKFEWE